MDPPGCTAPSGYTTPDEFETTDQEVLKQLA
jgi:hypothetical protein